MPCLFAYDGDDGLFSEEVLNAMFEHFEIEIPSAFTKNMHSSPTNRQSVGEKEGANITVRRKGPTKRNETHA